jgi:predicted enzyme related to lactoylglutathione lyase
MPEVAIYAPGTPMWIDLATSDVKAAAAFYGGLFGWAWEDAGPNSGGYGMFKLKGKQVAGAGPQQDRQQQPSWSMYVATEDADATAKKVKDAGGKVVAPPFDVMQAGRMAVFQDPAGAFFSVWQPNEHKGAEIANEDNAWGWSELNTNDIAGARKFYQKVFDWGIKDSPGEQPYTEWQVNGRSVGGGMEALPPNVPPHWATYFNVGDIKAAVDKARSLGGQVLMEPMDTPQGPFAVIRDPQGATFQIIEFRG